MEVVLPPGPGWSGAFLSGKRGAGNTNAVEDAAAVIVKRSFTVAGGALVPDGTGAAIALVDTVRLQGNTTPWTTVESDAALAKWHGDVIVLGSVPAPACASFVEIAGNAWLERAGAPPQSDLDLTENLFGWHPRAATARRSDARMVTGEATAPGDRYDRFHNAQRRPDGEVTRATQAALPAAATVAVRHRRTGGETDDIAVLDFAYAFPPLTLTLFLAERGQPDRAARWCPHVQGAMVFDTLILRPAAATASALWRRSWALAAIGPDVLRRAAVSVETA